MLTLCLVALAGWQPVGPALPLPAARVTLAWTHTIDKQRWEEDHEAAHSPQGPVLRLREARIRGSAAGMEPPEQAQLQDGWYRYRPALDARPYVDLMLSPYAAEYELCVQGRCRALSAWAGHTPAAGWRLQPCDPNPD
jgi:hypothetical protein